MYGSDIAISTGSGWANIQLENTITEVRAALAKHGHPYERSDDDLLIDIHSPETTFYFDDSNPKSLVQIVFYDKDHRVNEQQVIGLTLAEALLPFDVQSFDDTLWSLLSIEEEFPNGKPLPDAQRIRRASSERKMESGTLWIKSQGIGLVMLFGFVHAIAMRKIGSEPTVGCGHLDPQLMEMSLAQESPKKSEKAHKINPDHWPSIPSQYFTQSATPRAQPTSKNSQIRDEGWSISPYLLFGSIGIASLCLHWAFPNHIRLNGRRSRGSR